MVFLAMPNSRHRSWMSSPLISSLDEKKSIPSKGLRQKVSSLPEQEDTLVSLFS
jgi:hypothetical protein